MTSFYSVFARTLFPDDLERKQRAGHGLRKKQERAHHHRGELPSSRKLHWSVRGKRAKTDFGTICLVNTVDVPVVKKLEHSTHVSQR